MLKAPGQQSSAVYFNRVAIGVEPSTDRLIGTRDGLISTRPRQTAFFATV